tara:strand:- start:3790 stop:4995 length:1206 start_codon:yes stop_codon:yes gene_type:complete
MNLTIISQLFYPELISTGLTLTELCEALTKKGFKLNVIAGYPTVTDPKSPIPKKMTHQTISIERVWSTRFPKLNIFGKISNHLTLLFSLFFKLLFRSNKEPLLLLTNPPLLPLLMIFLYPIKKFNYSILLFDLYPDTIVAAKMLKNANIFVKLWQNANLVAYKNAEHIITIGRCMNEKIKQTLPSQYHHKLQQIPIWADNQLIVSTKDSVKFKERWGLNDQFVIGYSGNMARFHDIESLVKAAKLLQSYKHISFVFVGDGYKKQWAQDYVIKHKLSNCIFKSYVDRNQLGALLNSFDIGVVSLCKENTGLSVPSKTMGLLAAKKPILAIMDNHCEIALMINDFQNGVVVEPNQANQVAAQIISLSSDKKRLATFRLNSEKAMKEKYNLDHTARLFSKLFSK